MASDICYPIKAFDYALDYLNPRVLKFISSACAHITFDNSHRIPHRSVSAVQRQAESASSILLV